VGIVVSDFSRCVPVSEWETGWGISGHSGDVRFGSPCLKSPSAGSEKRKKSSDNGVCADLLAMLLLLLSHLQID